MDPCLWSLCSNSILWCLHQEIWPHVLNHDLYRRSPSRNQKWQCQNQWQRYTSSKWKGSQTFRIWPRNLYSFQMGKHRQRLLFLRVWVATDNNYVQVMPAPSVRGQHCGLCGNFNRNMFDEWTGKNEQLMTSAADMVNEWRWSSGP